MAAAKKTAAKKTEPKAEVKEESGNNVNSPRPVLRSGLTSVPHDDLNPAFALDTSL